MSQLPTHKGHILYLMTINELILASILFFMFLSSHHLSDHQSSDFISIFYWIECFQESYVVLFLESMLLIVTFLTAISSLVFSIFLVPPGKVLLAGILSIVALIITFLSTAPHFFVSYEHLMSKKINHNQFILGLRTAMDGDNFYIVGKCDRWLFRCNCYALTDVEVQEAERVIALEPDDHSNFLNVTLQSSDSLEEVTIPTKLVVAP